MKTSTRRDFVKSGVALAALPLMTKTSVQAQKQETVQGNYIPGQPPQLRWLEGEPAVHQGTVWGMPWPQGEVQKGASFHLRSKNGEAIATQTWPTAYWPDGSVKWTAHATPAGPSLGDTFSLQKGTGPAPRHSLRLQQDERQIIVDTGVIRCFVPKAGSSIIAHIERDGREVAGKGQLIGMKQDAPDGEPGQQVKVESFVGHTGRLSIEQEGPLRATVKVEGFHQTDSGRRWLPFVLRLYFHAGGEGVRVSHTFVFDGDENVDFIKGLGMRFDVPLSDDLHNRHVRLVGDADALWGESPRGITGLRRDPGKAVRDAQVAGEATLPLSAWDERVSKRLHWIPTWGDVTLSQLSANGFTIRKRTKAGHAWIESDQGKRAAGVGYLGGSSGGLVFGMRDFWQLHPTQIDIRNAGSPLGQATLWMWSPEAPAMDIRFYHDGLGQETYPEQLDALEITYEDYEPGFGTPHGVARTTELQLFAVAATPSRQRMVELADAIRQPGQVVAQPEQYLGARVFGGLWSLPDRSTPEKQAIEDRLQWSIEFYRDQVEQRYWYGFWNYGDVMHTYDADRHVWRYDVGGYAWDNSELSPDLWLWYSFLRSGQAEAFRLAERMTRHNRDVDIYHLGRFAGLGTRHNVQHWGCSAKQLRISTAAYRRFHYFLTADERTGDVLQEVVDADRQLARLNPTRKLPGQPEVPVEARIGVGTDFGSAAANWLTAWERTGDPKYKKWLSSAMETIGKEPLGFFAGVFGYDAETKRLIPQEDARAGVSHLSAVFGLFEICAEMIQLIEHPAFEKAWLAYCDLYNASDERQRQEFGHPLRGTSLRVAHSRLTAYAASKRGDAALAERAWKEFNLHEWGPKPKLERKRIEGPDTLNPIDEAVWVSTNDASQWGLAAIQNLALIGRKL